MGFGTIVIWAMLVLSDVYILFKFRESLNVFKE